MCELEKSLCVSCLFVPVMSLSRVALCARSVSRVGLCALCESTRPVFIPAEDGRGRWYVTLKSRGPLGLRPSRALP